MRDRSRLAWSREDEATHFLIRRHASSFTHSFLVVDISAAKSTIAQWGHKPIQPESTRNINLGISISKIEGMHAKMPGFIPYNNQSYIGAAQNSAQRGWVAIYDNFVSWIRLGQAETKSYYLWVCLSSCRLNETSNNFSWIYGCYFCEAQAQLAQSPAARRPSSDGWREKERISSPHHLIISVADGWIHTNVKQ